MLTSRLKAASPVVVAQQPLVLPSACCVAICPLCVCVRRHELTPAGLRYLLQPTHEQVWRLLREYIKAAEQASGGGGLGGGSKPQVGRRGREREGVELSEDTTAARMYELAEKFYAACSSVA